MIAVKILGALLGIAFMLSGYFIYFRKKYNLINGFEDDYKNGRKTEKYAMCVGLAEFIAGCVLSVVSLALFVFM